MKAVITSLFFTVAGVTIGILEQSHAFFFRLPPPSSISSCGFASSSRTSLFGHKEKLLSAIICTRTSPTSTRIYLVPYLPNIEEQGSDDNGSFFINASQQAAKDRFEMLKAGKNPLAISLSTASVTTTGEPQQQQQQQQESVQNEEEAETVDTDRIGKSNDGDENKLTSSSSSLNVEKDDSNGMLASLLVSPLAQPLEGKTKKYQAGNDKSSSRSSAPTTLDEIKRIEGDIAAAKLQMKDRFQKQLGDDLTVCNDDFNQPFLVGEGITGEEMEVARNARLAAAYETANLLVSDSGELVEERGGNANEIAKILVSDSGEIVGEEGGRTKSNTVDAAASTGEGRTAEEMEAARIARLAAADDAAMTSSKKPVDDTFITQFLEDEEIKEKSADSVLETLPPESPAPPAEAEVTAAVAVAVAVEASKSDEESSDTKKQPLLSSDGKEIYEPSQSELNMNQENVEHGLMVLTRSFFALNSIVQRRLDEDKKK